MLIAEMSNIIDYQLIDIEYALAYVNRAVIQPQMIKADTLISNNLTNI